MFSVFNEASQTFKNSGLLNSQRIENTKLNKNYHVLWSQEGKPIYLMHNLNKNSEDFLIEFVDVISLFYFELLEDGGTNSALIHTAINLK